jgi:nickel-dependent lactate racemase
VIEVSFQFDGTTRSVSLPEANLVSPTRGAGLSGPSLADVDLESILSRVSSARRLLVVVNDEYRPTPTRDLLNRMGDAVDLAGETKVAVACGMHPRPSAAFLADLAGALPRQVELTVHDASAPGESFGALSDDSPLELNPLVSWADCILLLGSVEPHFFAGFTGGAKQLLPGLATRRSIEANHRFAVADTCRPFQEAGNPIAEAIRETARLFADRLVSLQVVAGPSGWEAFCGTEQESFVQATQRCREVAGVVWPQALDLLLAAVEPPLDRNLYQLQKAFENHQWAVREGGKLVMLSACREGVGNDFFGPLAEQYPDWRHLPLWEDQTYSLGLHKLYRTSRTRNRLELYLHSTLPDHLVKRFYFEPVNHLDRWLDTHAAPGVSVGVVDGATASVSVLADG